MICNIHSVKVQVLLRGEKEPKKNNKKTHTHTQKTKQKSKKNIYIYKSITKYIKTIVDFL